MNQDRTSCQLVIRWSLEIPFYYTFCYGSPDASLSVVQCQTIGKRPPSMSWTAFPNSSAWGVETVCRLSCVACCCRGSINPSIYNIIRWLAEPMGQMTFQPSVWCSKYHFSFIKSCKLLCKNPFNLFYYLFYKITNMKIKSFECLKSKGNYEKKKEFL